MKYSIITLTHNRLDMTIRFVESVLAYSNDYELIVVDNNSTDGTVGYLQALKEQGKIHKLILNKENKLFSAGNNQGIEVADGDYIIVINNDVVVTPFWLESLEDVCKKNNAGIVGAMSNNSAGRQYLGNFTVPLPSQEMITEFATQHRSQYPNKDFGVGRIFGWMMFFKKTLLEEIGLFDERFKVGGYEDNDISLRAILKGHKLFIDYSTFLYHHGQATFQITGWEKYLSNGRINKEILYDKYKISTPQKLVAVYRITSRQEDLLRLSLQRTSLFADDIIVLVTRPKNNKVYEILKEFSKISKCETYTGEHQEDYERNWLLQEALKSGADWCISVDGDEIYQEKFIDKSKKMMARRNPEVLGYTYQWRTFWNSEKHFRADSTFGVFTNCRFFKLLPGQVIKSDHPRGHHCGSSPVIAVENMEFSNIKVEHWGYETEKARQEKYDFYSKDDVVINRYDVGNKDYTHLIDKNVILQEYDPKNEISCVMIIKNEEEIIYDTLEKVEGFVDEYIICDTGSTDKTKQEVQRFAEQSLVPVQIYDFQWADNFSLAKNFAKSKATKKWILSLDADEEIEKIYHQEIVRVIEKDCHAFLFNVINFLDREKSSLTQSIRLFRNIPEFYFTGIIHETIDDSVETMRKRGTLKIEATPFNLLHYGYLKKRQKIKDKLDSYEKLNLKQIEITEEKDARPFYNLALHYLQENNGHKADEFLHKALSIRPDFWQVHTEIASRSIRKANMHLKHTANLLGEQHGFTKHILPIIKFLDERDFGHEVIKL